MQTIHSDDDSDAVSELTLAPYTEDFTQSNDRCVASVN